MKIGSTGALFDCYGEKRYEKMREFGFLYRDFGIRGELNGMSEDDYFASIRAEAELAKASGVTIWQAHGPWRYPPHDETPELRAERFEVMARGIRAAGMIGCRYWVIHPLMPYGPDADFDLDRFYEINYDHFRRLLPVAKESGVVICFENMPMKRLTISTPEKTLEFIRAINDENFKMCLDTGHVSVHELSPADAVRMAGKDLAVLHVHDNMGKRDDHMTPATGVIDWADFGAALTEIGFNGVYSLESGWKDFLPHVSNDTRLRALRAVLDEIVPGGVTD